MPWAPLCAASITTSPSWSLSTKTSARSICPSTDAMADAAVWTPRISEPSEADADQFSAEAAAQHRIDDALNDVLRAVDNDPIRDQQAVNRRALRPMLPALHDPTEVFVGRMGNSTSRTPSWIPFEIRYPASAKICAIRRF